MPTKNVNLTDRYAQFIDQLIESGEFKNASEVMRAGLRLLEQSTREDRQKLAVLRKLAVEGFEDLDQGRGVELPTPGAVEQKIAELGLYAAKSVRSEHE